MVADSVEGLSREAGIKLFLANVLTLSSGEGDIYKGKAASAVDALT